MHYYNENYLELRVCMMSCSSNVTIVLLKRKCKKIKGKNSTLHVTGLCAAAAT